MDSEFYPGRSNLSIEAVGDRLAILNLLSAYAHYAQRGDLDSWAALFHPDAVFTTTADGVQPYVRPINEVIEIERPFFETYRKIHLDPTSGERKLYRFSHPFIQAQEASFIKFTFYASLLRLPVDASPPCLSFAATYEGECRKLKRMRDAKREFTVFGSMQVEPLEAAHLQNSWKRWRSFKITAHLLARYLTDLLRFGRGTRFIRGQALVGRMLKSAVELDIAFFTGVKVEELLWSEGRVGGVRVDGKDYSGAITASCGVVLATGGFAANRAMVARYFPMAEHHVQMLPDTNQGDGIVMAEAVGAALGADNANNGIWMPASSHPLPDGTIGRFPDFSFNRVKPGAILVDGSGRRFVNEALSYHSLVRVMYERDVAPAWLVGDRRFMRKYGMGLVRPFPYPFRHFIRSGYLMEGRTIADLARQIGVNADRLAETVRRFNGFAASGIDEDFGKGADIYSRALGDAEHGPNPCLGAIEQGPFYAIALYPSACGTALGLRGNEHGQVLDRAGWPIDGLYAAGLDMNSALRGTYPGAGANIGPAMTFGYAAGQHATRSLARA